MQGTTEWETFSHCFTQLPRSSTVALVLVILLSAGACLRRDGRNTDCRWPNEPNVQAPTPRHLSSDAEFAEDLAIRYADTHHGLRSGHFISGEAYGAAVRQCMSKLFSEIAKEHDVQPEQVFGALGRNRGHIDLAVNLPFGILAAVGAVFVTRWIWNRYRPAEHGWLPGVILTFFVALVFVLAVRMAGEMWSWLGEISEQETVTSAIAHSGSPGSATATN
jgi:hypothetical protein